VVADPEQRLSALPILGAAEATQLLIDWNATAVDYPREQSIAAGFEAQVDATPHAIALLWDGESMTYDALDRRANQLAHHLRALGVSAERVVGVWMDRSPEMIVTLLAILKAGGAYVPFDLLAPPARLAAMVSIAKVDLVLTREARLSELATLGIRAIAVDADAEAIARWPAERLGPLASAESLAYVMFTSGSTGEPKGVAVTHRSVVRLVKGVDYASFGPDEVFLHLSSPSFDASTFEIWGALLNGGRLAIAPPEVPSVAAIGGLLRQYGVTTLWLTAGLFHAMVDHGLEALRPLRRLLAGGDVLSAGPRRARARHAARAPPRQRLRPHRRHHVHLLSRGDERAGGRPLGPDRPAHRQHARVRARSPPAPTAPRRSRRAVHRRRRSRRGYVDRHS
jgi:non-ribosomal peptide synthetase component F